MGMRTLMDLNRTTGKTDGEQNAAVVLVGGDLCPSATDEQYFKEGSTSRLLGDYAGLWDSADFRILNLECPLTSSERRIRKIGPHLKAAPGCAAWFRNARVGAVCLANNHIKDYGEVGVVDTLHACESAGVATVGAGANLEQARTPLVATLQGLKLGVIAVAEHEFSIATPDTPGANPIDYRNLSLVREIGAQTDFLLVLVHGGTEMLAVPRPGLVELCRFLVDQGAGAVIVQHTHCVGCYERYKNAPIVYGQGNFIFAPVAGSGPDADSEWFVGMMVELRLRKGQACAVRFHPYEQSRGFAGIRPLTEERRDTFVRDLEARSQGLSDAGQACVEWRQYCQKHRSQVLAMSLGISGILASLHSRLRLSRLFSAMTNVPLRHNMVRCESHRELVEACLSAEERVPDDCL